MKERRHGKTLILIQPMSNDFDFMGDFLSGSFPQKTMEILQNTFCWIQWIITKSKSGIGAKDIQCMAIDTLQNEVAKKEMTAATWQYVFIHYAQWQLKPTKR